MKRVFIGGCSRSGTTFLQEFLASHSRILTFPETGFFLRAFGMRGWMLPWARMGLSLGKERKALSRLPGQLGLDPDQHPPLPPRRFSLEASVQDAVAFLDTLAEGRGKDVWLEKTPRHVLYASRIRRLVSGSTFIHMVRDGRAVVASMVDRARRFPEEFSRQQDPAYGIRQWNRSLEATQRAMKEPGHLLVLYEGLATHPEKTLRSLCETLDLGFERSMMDRTGPRTFVREGEEWKDRRKGPIAPAASKFSDLFSKRNREQIENRLKLRYFEEIRDRILADPGSVLVGRKVS